MNSHSDIQKLLSAYCGDDLATHDSTLVELHLKECPACRAELADLKVTLQVIRSTPAVDPPPWLTSRIMANIKEQQTERRNWLQRIFFPLHIKLPLELIGLLVVCVTGYYLSQTVETELKAPRTLQELPGSLPQEMKPAKEDAPPQPMAAPPVPSQPASPKQLDRPADSMRQQPEYAAPPPAVEPAAGKYERSAPAAAGSAAEPASKAAPAADFSNRTLEAAPELKKKDAKGVQRQEAESLAPAPAGRAATGSVVKYLPQLSLRLTVADRSTAADSIRAAAIRSGAKIIEEDPQTTNRARIRIPAARYAELLERLSRIGRLADRPQPQHAAEELEVTILW
jgi:hypothetical protein